MNDAQLGRPMEILLIEDSIVNGRLTARVLRQGDFQHRLHWLTDGNEALQYLHRRSVYRQAPHPDLILLDLSLPGADGLQILKDLRHDPELQKIPVVVLTASRQEEIGERLDVSGYLTKPFDYEAFLSLVRELNRFWHKDLVRFWEQAPVGAEA